MLAPIRPSPTIPSSIGHLAFRVAGAASRVLRRRPRSSSDAARPEVDEERMARGSVNAVRVSAVWTLRLALNGTASALACSEPHGPPRERPPAPPRGESTPRRSDFTARCWRAPPTIRMRSFSSACSRSSADASTRRSRCSSARPRWRPAMQRATPTSARPSGDAATRAPRSTRFCERSRSIPTPSTRSTRSAASFTIAAPSTARSHASSAPRSCAGFPTSPREPPPRALPSPRGSTARQ